MDYGILTSVNVNMNLEIDQITNRRGFSPEECFLNKMKPYLSLCPKGTSYPVGIKNKLYSIPFVHFGYYPFYKSNCVYHVSFHNKSY